MQNQSETIKPADKGGNIVIQNNTDYVHMCRNLLDNSDWYRPIPKSLTDNYIQELYILVDGAYFCNIIDKNT